MPGQLPSAPAGFGPVLKRWRARRRVSQLDLALEAGVSARHLAFLETGRARPSREMVVTLGAALEVPLRERNELLLAAGFAPVYPEHPLSAERLAPIRLACETLLRRHEPYPAIQFDRHWNLLAANAAARRMFGLPDGDAPVNIVRLLAGHPAIDDLVQNWPDVAHDMLARLRLEAANAGPDPELGALIALLAAAAPPYNAKGTAVPRANPFVVVHLQTPLGAIKMFSTIAEFGTVEDITVRDLRVELFFPSDAVSAAVLEALAKG